MLPAAAMQPCGYASVGGGAEYAWSKVGYVGRPRYDMGVAPSAVPMPHGVGGVMRDGGIGVVGGIAVYGCGGHGLLYWYACCAAAGRQGCVIGVACWCCVLCCCCTSAPPCPWGTRTRVCAPWAPPTFQRSIVSGCRP